MLQLHTLRLYVDQRLSAVTEDIFRRFAAVVAEYEREVLRLKTELGSTQRSPPPKAGGAQSGDRMGPSPREGRQGERRNQPAGVPEDFTPEEEPVQDNRDTMCPPCPKIKFESANGQLELCVVKQEMEEDLLITNINPKPEDEDNREEANLSLHTTAEQDNSSGPQTTDTDMSCQAEQRDEDLNTSIYQYQFYEHEEPLFDSSGALYKPEPGEVCGPALWSRNSPNELEIQNEFSDSDMLESSDQSTTAAHAKLISRRTMFACTSCNREFSSKTSLRKHMRRYPEKEQGQLPCRLQRQKAPYQRSSARYSCKVCRSSFYTQGILLRHSESHCREPRSQCGVCGECLGSTEALMEHLQSHKELGVTCDVCGKKWSSMKRMEIHKRIHTGEKPYKCGVCSLQFSRRESLVRHSKVHSGEQPHLCGICSKNFSRREYLIRHLKDVHKLTE